MYEKLLLVNGGGITGESQKGIQAGHCANIVIGLGGTGKSCVRMIKTYAYQRLQLQADDVNGVFRHIRFFSVDTDFVAERAKEEYEMRTQQRKEFRNLLPLNADELLDIESPGLVAAMAPAPWNDWWYVDPKKEKSKEGSGNGSGGDRKLGRLRQSYNASSILSRIRDIYNEAVRGLNVQGSVSGQSDEVYFHIISGMGGGTGAGTFIDLCYLLKNEFSAATIIGYFFLPEVNEDVVATDNTKKYIRQNGFAAMQDLDYVMHLDNNRGTFSQMYNGSSTPVKWVGAPVEMCHIISNEGHVGLGYAAEKFNYAMNVVAEYVMDFLVNSSNQEHTLKSEINNKDARVKQENQKRRSGYYCDYSSMGSSSAVVPYREINTYVISNLFAKFSQIFNEEGDSIPSAKDCFTILKDAFAPNATTFEDLNRAVYQKAASGLNTGVYTPYSEDLTEINWADVVTDDDELKKLRADITIPKPLHSWYNKQYADKTGVIAKNVNSLINTGNQESLINLIRTQLDTLTKNIYRGPSFACKAIDAAVKDSLKDVIEGLIASNKTMYGNACANLSLCAKDYNDAVSVIKRKNTKHKRGESALNALVAFYNQLGLIDLYEGIILVLTKLKDQLTDGAKKDYARLETVYNELKSRFDSNLRAIESHNSTVVDTSYAEYLVKIDQLRVFLDAELVKAVPNIPNTFESFIEWISDPDHKELLQPEHEDEFIRYLNKFFVDDQNGLFNGLVTMTIDDYLRMAYANDNNISDWHSVTNVQLQGYVLHRIRSLLNKAEPLFNLDRRVQDSLGAADGWLTIPAGSGAIAAAAAQATGGQQGLKISKSDLSDRIFVEKRHDGVSMSALSRVSALQNDADQDSMRHLYSGAPKKDGVFNDWGELPPLTPYQLWDGRNERFNSVKAAAKTFDDAIEIELIVPKTKNYLKGITIREYNFDAIAALNSDVSAFKTRVNGLTAMEIEHNQSDLLSEMAMLKSRLEKLFSDGEDMELSFDPQPASSEDDPIAYRKAFYRDIFVRAPQIVMDVNKQLSHSDEYNAVVKAVDECEILLNKRIDSAGTENKTLPIFETSLYAGLFTIKGNNITCDCKDERTDRDLIPNPLTDSSKRDEFPYSNIPIYQAFLTFMNLDADVIAKIGKIADDKANEMFNPGSSVDEGVESFMGRMSVWYNLAERYTDSKKIIEFLENENQQFRYFKEERGI